MADLSQQITQARQAGYSDTDIAAHLSQTDPQFQQAKQAGYSDADILTHLAPQRDAPISMSNAQLRATVAQVSPPTRIQVAKTEVQDSLGRLASDVKGALTPSPSAPGAAVRNGPLAPLPANPTLVQRIQHPIDQALHAFAGGDNGTGEVQTNTPGGQAALAADRVGGDLMDVPMSLGRAAVRAVNPNLSSEQAQGYTAAALAGAPVLGALGREAPAIAGAFTPRVSSTAADNVAAMERANVTPSLATAAPGKGSSALTNSISENPIAGVLSRGRAQANVAETEAEANRIAGQYGNVRGPQITGENVQAGVNRFANDKSVPGDASAPAKATSFAAKAGSLYDDAFNAIDAGQQATLDAANRAAAIKTGQGGASVAPQPVIQPTATRAALNDMGASVNAGGLAKIIQDPRLNNVATALDNGSTDLRFGDLRALRTWTREAQSNPELRQGITQGNLQRLEGALTDDITQNAFNLAGPAAARQLQRADQYYAAGSQRIQNALQPFADASSGENAYSKIAQAAGSTGSADAQKLLSLKRSLKSDEWGDVAANVISDLGKPTPGQAGMGQTFSVSSFLTNYNKMSPQGRQILFGDMGGGGASAASLRSELDNLAHVAGLVKNVEKGANTSKSAVSGQAVGTLAGLATPHLMAPTATLLGTMGITGEVMTNPAFVRWLAKNTNRLDQAGPKAAATNQLRQLAQKDHRLLPIVSQLVLNSRQGADATTSGN